MQTNRIKHIGVFLAVLFIYPLVCQSFHVLHDHDYLSEHRETSCCSLWTDEENEHLETGSRECAVCTYEFATIHLENLENDHVKTACFHEQKFDLFKQDFKVFSGSSAEFRGPPIIA